MRSIIVFIFLSLSSLHAQQHRLSIEWDGSTTHSVGSLELSTPYFGNGYQFDGKAILYATSLKGRGKIDQSSIEISSLQSSIISKSDLLDLKISDLPTSLRVTVVNSLSRKQSYTQITATPIYMDGATIRRVESLVISYRVMPTVNYVAARGNIRSSLLIGGDWFKFEVTESGVQRLTGSMLEDMGFNLGTVLPDNIKIYGHGGRSMSLINGVDQFFDPPELAIQVLDGGDGRFDPQDQILFYGTSTNSEYVPENDSFINPYSDSSIYYITVNGGRGKRIAPYVQPSGAVANTYDYFHARNYIEQDLENIGSVGRIWYGDRFDFEPEASYQLNFTDVDPSRNAIIRVATGAVSDTNSSMEIAVNGSALGVLSFTGLSGGVVSAADREVLFRNTLTATPALDFTLTYSNGGNPAAVGYLDYIWVDMPQRLNNTIGDFVIRNLDADRAFGIGQYNFTNAGNLLQLWRVTDPFNVSSYENQGSQSDFSLTFRQGSQEEFIAVQPAVFKTPTVLRNSRVANQDLKGSIFDDSSGQFQDLDYLIITPSFLAAQAQRLANFHITTNNLNTKVVPLELIYNEFSEGEQDIAAIRNFVKYVYDNASDPSRRLRYLNMFGDASYDFKSRLRINDNIVPTFQSANSTDLTLSYCTDDFFTFMDDGEGSAARQDLMDIAVGRMIVSNTTEARQAVDKVINYYAEPSFARWRNRISLIGDDVDILSDRILQRSTSELGDEIFTNRPEYNINKILLDSYPQVLSAGGDRYPSAIPDIRDSFEQGSLVVNYFGHGNEDGLAREFVITQSLVEGLRNINNLPLLITVTCEFTRYDNPLRVSGGEIAYLNPRGGAIASVATNRLIFVSTGTQFNEIIDQYLFSYENVEPTTIAEALRLAKVDPAFNNDGTRRVIAYIGDPALTLGFPKPRVVLNTVNGNPINPTTAVLRGLDRVTLGGEVQDLQGNLINDYNGTISVTVFDKDVNRETLANDRTRDTTVAGDPLVVLEFDQLGEVLFRGQATIAGGIFSIDFVMPRDTQIPVSNGRVSFYAKRSNVREDQNGFSEEIRVGGINENATEDNMGPEIIPYMNDTNFVSGGITDSNPFLLVLLNDANGINTSSGIGHDLTAILDGDESNPFILNDYYEADVDDFTSGRALFPLRDIPPGLHTLKITVWDTYNNSSMNEIQFVVSADNGLQLSRVLNYPNPFTSYTEFWFNHNKPFEPLDVQVQVMTVTGKIVWSKSQSVTTSGFTSREITWDGRDDFGQRLGKGVYVYKITVNSPLSDETASIVEKLVIL
ncbi:MAG: type IX secretion system sortase PorU [Nonlabens sp.]